MISKKKITKAFEFFGVEWVTRAMRSKKVTQNMYNKPYGLCQCFVGYGELQDDERPPIPRRRSTGITSGESFRSCRRNGCSSAAGGRAEVAAENWYNLHVFPVFWVTLQGAA